MIAHGQRWVCALALLLSLAWAASTIGNGQAWAALLLPGGLLAGYAGFLGAEFVLLRWHASEPPPDAASLLRAWAAEVLTGLKVFCWRQPFRSRRWPDRLPADGGGRQGVLLLHGFMCNRGLWNRWLARLSRTEVPFIALDLEPVFGPIELYRPAIEAAVRTLESCTGRPPVVVAHSMGGLALRRWWVEPGNAVRVAHFISLATPHRGTWLARLGLGFNVRQMRLNSAWLRELAAVEPASWDGRATCFYGSCDNIVFPAAGATLPGADLHRLAGVAHVCMVDRPEPWAALQRWLKP